MAELLPWPKPQFTDDNGRPLSGGRLYTYRAGTSIPLATYADRSATAPNANPVILNSRGEAPVYLGAAKYKLILCDENDAVLWTIDNFFVTETDNETLAQAITDAQAAQAAAEQARDEAVIAKDAAEYANSNIVGIIAEATEEAIGVATGKAEDAASASEAARDLSIEWATKTDGQVDETDYSSKAYAQSEGLVSTGSSKEWAIKTDGAVYDGEYSAKKYAQDAASAKTDAETAAGSASGAKTAAENARDLASGYASSASGSASAASSAKDAAVIAKSGAESARDTAISAKDDAVLAKIAAQAAATSIEAQSSTTALINNTSNQVLINLGAVTITPAESYNWAYEITRINSSGNAVIKEGGEVRFMYNRQTSQWDWVWRTPRIGDAGISFNFIGSVWIVSLSSIGGGGSNGNGTMIHTLRGI